ncbi:MAG: preprotein translocase subunit SecA [Parcubacteria group bacterium]|nr:preprotein translocase subunit SecA [Parcubacteria group bacterium]
MSLWTKIFGDSNERYLKKLWPIVREVNNLEEKFSSLRDEDFPEMTQKFRERLKNGETLEDILPEAFSLVREAARRALNKRHFDVQILGGIVLHKGQIAEMRTGEGKTQTAVLAAYLNALTGRGVHVVTVNDYLAKRDTLWMGQIYSVLGISVACLQHAGAYKLGEIKKDQVDDVRGVDVRMADWLMPVSRREAYNCDILYGTNSEFGFDYLRDNMVTDLAERVQKPLHFAIIDEVDSILIDEARTPLIISAPAHESSEKYQLFAKLVRNLKGNEDYNIDEKMRAASLTEAGIAKLEKALGVDNIYVEAGVETVHHIEQALRANTLYKLDRDYVVKDGEVIIVDEFTGRLMYGRRYGEGLHQAIEAKEGLKVQEESQTLATVTIQNYFRMYEKLAGMTGTAATEAEEFAKIYKLDVAVVPTHQLMIRKDLPDRIYRTERAKFEAIVEEIVSRHELGQPVLMGTISIEKNELISEMLSKRGIPHQVLNAKHHEREAEIIAQAGRLNAVTVATNMAGRGVDIILGGNPPDAAEAEKVKALGGLLVLGTERHESRRIDNQLRGRSGRQGDPGMSQFYISLEDDLMRIFGPMERMKGLMLKLGVPDNMPIENALVSRSIEAAQKKVEGHNFDLRKHVLEYDDVINKHREIIYKKRHQILQDFAGDTEKIKQKVLDLIENEIKQIIAFHTAADQRESWNIKEITEVSGTILPAPSDLEARLRALSDQTPFGKEGDAAARTRIIEYLLEIVRTAYQGMEAEMAEKSGGNKLMIREIEKGLLLRAIDSLWIDHLTAMDYLRTGIRLRGYAQKDPLVEYKKEAFRMFNELMSMIQKQVVYGIFKIGAAADLTESMLGRRGIRLIAPSDGGGSAETSAADARQFPKVGSPAVASPWGGTKVGRNDPCPCGSGMKYKKCHGA